MITWEYLAGFWDGEGTLKCYRNGPRASVAQNTSEVIYAIRDFLEIPNTITKYQTGVKKRWIWCLQIQRRDHLLYLVQGMLPHLIVKRDAALELLEVLNNAPNPRVYHDYHPDERRR